MMNITSIKAQRALSRTSIDIADFVINPYKGCEFGCVYCYTKQNKTMLKRRGEWGGFVEAKENLPSLLRDELNSAKEDVKRVLIGSVTEPYQPIEKEKGITRDVLKTLSEFDIKAVVLTRSPLVCRDADILKGGAHKIFFTVNTIRGKIKESVEPNSPGFEQRLDAIKALFDSGVDVRVHIGPFIPGITDVEMILERLPVDCRQLELEMYNFKMGSWEELAPIFKEHAPEAFSQCRDMMSSQENYTAHCAALKEEVSALAQKYGKEVLFFFPPYDSFFKNEEYNYEVT